MTKDRLCELSEHLGSWKSWPLLPCMLLRGLSGGTVTQSLSVNMMKKRGEGKLLPGFTTPWSEALGSRRRNKMGPAYVITVASNWRTICGSGSVRSSHQTVSDYTLRQWFPNTQQSRFLTACRRLEKLVLPSIFDTSLSSLTLMTWNLQSYPTTVSNEIMWTF